ncbi:MAG: hypothetical protein JOZ19_01270 [Rubrobacter sp.]|nr:hypothetical protein [Rubrobacter sp.]
MSTVKFRSLKFWVSAISSLVCFNPKSVCHTALRGLHPLAGVTVVGLIFGAWLALAVEVASRNALQLGEIAMLIV